MKIHFLALVITGLLLRCRALHVQTPLRLEDAKFLGATSEPCAGLIQGQLISECTEQYIQTLLTRWKSSGLAVAVVRKDASSPNGWKHEFGSYGIAQANGSPMTPDTVFSIASNSKLFLAVSVGLLISNKTLAQERGQELKWSTKVRDVIPEWKLMDEDMDRGTTFQDMLSHRTGMPRHDFSNIIRKGGVADTISTLRYLRPSAEFRETFQYNNLMYETLSYLPVLLLNQTYESYIAQHIFEPLNMTSSTYSVAEAEARGTFADGFQWDMQDLTRGINGTFVPTVPFYLRPGEESAWAGAGGVLSSARDMANWMSMLMNNGRHPYTHASVVPEDIIEHVAYGRSVGQGKSLFPEFSPKVYGAGQFRYSYQGRDIIEHGGSSLGFKTQVARFPDDNLGVITLSNDENGLYIEEAVKFRIADEILGLKELDWNDRYEKQWNETAYAMQQLTSRPSPPKPPSQSFTALAQRSFHHPAYGTLQPCLVPKTVESISTEKSADTGGAHAMCPQFLASYPVQRILSASNLSIPTYIIPWRRSFATHIRLAHFSENLFNITILWSNADVREREGYGTGKETGGDVLAGLGGHYEAEWVQGEGEEEGLAFKDGFWGREGLDSMAPEGVGRDSAEVWFSKV